MSENYGDCAAGPIAKCATDTISDLKSQLAAAKAEIKDKEAVFIGTIMILQEIKESAQSESKRLREALRTIIGHEEIAGWDPNPTATLYGLAKSALDGLGK